MTKKSDAVVREIKVVSVSDDRDEQDLLSLIYYFTENGIAHVRFLGTAEGWPYTYAVSNLPISYRQAIKVVHDREIEFARNSLQTGHDPYDVLNSYFVSVAEVRRIAKQEGVDIPRGWVRIGQEKEKERKANDARAKVEGLEVQLAKVSSELVSARTLVQVPQSEITAVQTM
jgi:hypothetical protein